MTGEKVAQILLDDAQFREAHKHSNFWKRRIDPTLLSQLFSWRELNHCLSFNRITNDRFRMSTDSEHSALNKRAFCQVKDKFGRSTDCLVMNELHRLMREGVTGVLEAVNELSPAVCSLRGTHRWRTWSQVDGKCVYVVWQRIRIWHAQR